MILRNLAISALVLGLLAVGAGPAEAQQARKNGYRLVSGQVTGMRASIYNRPTGGPGVSEFEVPADFHDRILDCFDDAESFSSQIDWAVLGELKITTARKTRTLTLFSAVDSIVFDSRRTRTGTLDTYVRAVDDALRAKAAAAETKLDAQTREVQTLATMLSTALGIFRIDCGRFPTAQEGLGALIKNPGVKKWAGPYIPGKEAFTDPWGTALRYAPQDEKNLRLTSAGPDRNFGSPDDISITK